jgi:hypothetical protein
MSRYQRVSDELRQAILIFTHCGVPQKTIAHTFEVAPSRVSDIQQGLNLNPRGKSEALPLATIQKILEMHKHNGGPYIARKLNLPVSQVYLVLRAYDSMRPPKRSGRHPERTRYEKMTESRKKIIQNRYTAFVKQQAKEFRLDVQSVRKLLRRRQA